jgi:tetratricopeptide (TPR) repeat protein
VIRPASLAPLLFASISIVVLAGCPSPPPGPTPAPLQHAFERGDALAIADALEALIGDGKDTGHDRQLAYDRVKSKEEPTAAYAYARAMVTGRLVQVKGLTAAFLVREMEDWAQKSRSLDPTFRSGAATRMLGTLYVLAPASLLKGGDSEKGLELLEKLVREHPDAPENHLRLAEALIALGDPAPATEPLCKAQAQKARLQKDDQHLLEKLIQDAGSPACP